MASKLKIFLFGLLLIIFLLICIIVHHAYIPITKPTTNFKYFEYQHNDKAIERFMGGLRFQTVSWKRGNQNFNALENLRMYIYKHYPLLHSSKQVRHDIINNYSLLYIIKGRNTALKPAVLLAHMDVVPTKGQDWKSDPFTPIVKDGYIYARGTLDDKGCLFGILESVERLLKENHQFERDVILGFGHDEEVSGHEGAAHISKKLYALGYRYFEFITDEGTVILKEPFPTVTKTFALIGTAQKGYATANLSIEHAGGHSSMPTRESAIGILSDALTRIEKNPFPNLINHGPETELLNRMSRELPFYKRIILANTWLFRPLIDLILSTKPQTNAMLRTTTAITQFHAGIKDNVLSASAWATVNLRVHPGQTVEEALNHLRHLIADDRIKMEVYDVRPSMGPAGGQGTFGYDLLEATINQMSPSVIVSPGLMIAMTDSLWYTNFTKNIYLFNPTALNVADLPGIHGKNERISVESYQKLIEFYYRMLKNMKTFTVEEQGHSHNTEL